MDIFIEKIITKDKSVKDTILKILIVTIAIILCIVALFFPTLGSLELLKYVNFVLAILVVYVAYRLLGSLNVEYEYSVTSDYIDIAKIMSQRRRKKVIRIEMGSIAIIAPITYPEHMSINKKEMQRVIYAVGNMQNNDVYYIIAKVDGKLCLVYIEPDERILEAFKTDVKSKFKE